LAYADYDSREKYSLILGVGTRPSNPRGDAFSPPPPPLQQLLLLLMLLSIGNLMIKN